MAYQASNSRMEIFKAARLPRTRTQFMIQDLIQFISEYACKYAKYAKTYTEYAEKYAEYHIMKYALYAN